MGESDKTHRSENWTALEKEVLVNNVVQHYRVLFGEFNNSVTKAQKISLWISMADLVSATSGKRRSVEQVKKKWVDLKSAAKSSACRLYKSQVRTGGGESEITDIDSLLERISACDEMTRKIARVIGVDGICGIPEGIDSSESQLKRTHSDAFSELSIDINDNEQSTRQPKPLNISEPDTIIDLEDDDSTISISQPSTSSSTRIADKVTKIASKILAKVNKKNDAGKCEVKQSKDKDVDELRQTSEKMLAVQEDILVEFRVLNTEMGRLATAIENLIK